MTRKRSEELASLGDLVLGRLPPEEARALLERVEEDSDLSEELEIRIALSDFGLSAGRNVWTERVIRSSRGLLWIPHWIRRTTAWTPAYVSAVTIFFFGMVVFAILRVGAGGGNQYLDLVDINRSEIEFRTRQIGDDDLKSATARYSEGRFNEGARHLDRYVRIHPQSPIVGYVRYSAALGYLAGARAYRLGIVPVADTIAVRRALALLAQAADDSSTQAITDDIRWYRALALLLVEDPESALLELERVVAAGGDRADDAVTLIDRILAVREEE